MIKKLNDYLLAKWTCILGSLLTLLGFTGCEFDSPCAYGTISPTADIISETTGIILDTDGEPVPNVEVMSFPTEDAYHVKNIECVTSDGNGKYSSNSTIERYGNKSVSSTFKKLQVIASDKSGVYENDTMYVDVQLDSVATNKFKATATANFTLRKK